MSDFSLTLGPVAFAGFELPSSLTLGGRQRLAIHRLPGGLRIVDALGADPADLAWSGIFTGPDAPIRARALDTLRISGAAMPLAWDAFLYTVVIESFEADYRSPWWIPYRISCAVIRDEAAALFTAAVALVPAIAADLAYAGPAAISAGIAIATQGAGTAGTHAYVAASQACAGTLASLNNEIIIAEPAIQADDVPSAALACGILAQLTAARAYAARAYRNLAAASS